VLLLLKRYLFQNPNGTDKLKLLGKPLFTAHELVELSFEQSQLFQNFPTFLNDNIQKEWRPIISKLLEPNPKLRESAEQLLSDLVE
jgi:hypothetical protein